MGEYRSDTFTGLAHHGDIHGMERLFRNPNHHSHIEADEGGIGYHGRAMTALGIASKSGDLNMMRQLIKAGANPTGVAHHDNYYTATPLFAAVMSRDIDAVRLMIGNGADVNSSASMHPDTGGGATAMYYAAKHGLLDIAMELHHYGACLLIPTGNGDTAVNIAATNRHTKFVHWIEMNSSDRTPATYRVPDINGNMKNVRIGASNIRHPYHNHGGMNSIYE
jgi:ankyrin repeat protein